MPGTGQQLDAVGLGVQPTPQFLAETVTGCSVTPDVVVAYPSRNPRGLERETGGQFTLSQNYPNPYVGETTVPFALAHGGDVKLDLFDAAGRKMAGIARKSMAAGAHTIGLNLSGLGLPPGNYLYQLQVTNSYGVYRQSKTMTAD